MRRVLVLDLDGTLLDSSLSFSFYTESIIKKMKDEGFLIILASGRPYRSMEGFYKRLGLSTPLIAYNGALVFNPVDQSFPIYSKRFPASSLKNIARKCSFLSSFMVEGGEMIYLQNEDTYLDAYFPYSKEKHLIGKIDEIIKEDCYTSIFNCTKEESFILEKAVNEEGIILRRWNGNTHSEGALPNVNKGEALKYIIKQLNIDAKNSYAFGDSDNDFEMLSLIGHPFVAKNSKSKLLKATFPITEKGNDQDGVAFELNRIFKLL